jgi:hypothetical protein
MLCQDLNIMFLAVLYVQLIYITKMLQQFCIPLSFINMSILNSVDYEASQEVS